jgi:hypothetical protein
MPSLTTRTINPLPFSALEPKRFEDLIRQLAYDFRPWRILEATGRSGSDDGYDARGFEIVGDGAEQDVGDADDEEADPPTLDRQWLIQCKRENSITPKKLRNYLEEITDPGSLYGVIFAAACDFSKRARDDAFAWARQHGIAEMHIWGKAEVEDQLYQPKNDHLLFAYFGISLQIRKRSIRTALRAKLTMKRKAMRHLGDRWHDNKMILLRDPENEDYPYVEDGLEYRTRAWQVVEFTGHRLDCIKLRWRSFYAFLSLDGKHWDYANVFDNRGNCHYHDPWLSRAEGDKLADLRTRITDYWHDEIPELEQARFDVECLIKYDDIVEIDEKGDDVASFPHVFVSLKNGQPLRAEYIGTLRADTKSKEIDGNLSLPPPRVVEMPSLEDLIQRFPSEFRKPVR